MQATRDEIMQNIAKLFYRTIAKRRREKENLTFLYKVLDRTEAPAVRFSSNE